MSREKEKVLRRIPRALALLSMTCLAAETDRRPGKESAQAESPSSLRMQGDEARTQSDDAAWRLGPLSDALPRHVLTNEGLVILARAGIGDSLLRDLILHKRTQFDTSAEALAALARRGISEEIIRAVVEKQEHLPLRPAGRPSLSGSAQEPVELRLVLPPASQKKRASSARWYRFGLP